MTRLWESFDQHLARSAPTDWHRRDVRRFRQRIYDTLTANFRLMSLYQSGSFQHGTAIMPFSDVDYIARIHFEDRPKSSTTALNRVRDSLAAEFEGELWDLHVDRPAVTLRFNALITDYEITPAYLLRGTTDDDRVVLIPAPGGEWREAAPKAHNKFVSEMDKRHSGHDVRELARLLKAWKYEQAVPISSFYLEMRAAEYGKNHDSIWPLEALRDIAAALIATNLAAMNDPTRLVSRIASTSSEYRRTSSLKHLHTFKQHLDTANSLYFRKGASRWKFNEALRGIWGETFPYTDTYHDE